MKPKKKPQDYPQFAFRVSDDVKQELMDKIEAVAKALNKGRTEDDRVIRNNDVIIRAIYKGLPLLKKKDFD